MKAGQSERFRELWPDIKEMILPRRGIFAMGFVLMVISRPYFKTFFSRKPETAPPGILDQPIEALPAQVDF